MQWLDGIDIDRRHIIPNTTQTKESFLHDVHDASCFFDKSIGRRFTGPHNGRTLQVGLIAHTCSGYHKGLWTVGFTSYRVGKAVERWLGWRLNFRRNVGASHRILISKQQIPFG